MKKNLSTLSFQKGPTIDTSIYAFLFMKQNNGLMSSQLFERWAWFRREREGMDEYLHALFFLVALSQFRAFLRGPFQCPKIFFILKIKYIQ